MRGRFYPRSSVKVFISHYSGDAWVARQIGRELRRLGIETFLDDDVVETGDAFDETIRSNLLNADEVLVLLSPEALERPYVWVEISAGWLQEKRVVGILYRMSATQVTTREGIPAFLKRTQLRRLEELDRYLDEVRRRAER